MNYPEPLASDQAEHSAGETPLTLPSLFGGNEGKFCYCIYSDWSDDFQYGLYGLIVVKQHVREEVHMEPKVLTNVQFLPTTKRVWSSLKEMYSQENNLSRIYDLFESLFKTKQGDQPIDEYYSTMKGLWEELLLYQPFTVNLEKQREQCEHFQHKLFRVLRESIWSIAKESSGLLSTPSNRGGRGGVGGGISFNGRGARGNSGFGRVVPIPVVPSEEVPPAPVMPCAEGPSRVPITTVRGSMPIYAQYHRIFPRKKVTNVESAPVTTIEPALKQSSSSLEAPSVLSVEESRLPEYKSLVCRLHKCVRGDLWMMTHVVWDWPSKRKRVTRVELNRRIRRKEKLKTETEAKKIEKLSKEIDSLPDILEEISKDDEEKQKRHVRCATTKQEKLKSGPPHLGR
ncbi:hypothetical protein IFM89_026364 [Coptis chinensis]|uniref:Ribosome biogenesis protein NOP53 n=1 Tax=Coptis chinensis TaxID=261450 RepID=A0A835LWR6_9MAGN|nr:hypothetical protein IFM89_026364 [Coptis chinensis]